MSTKYLYLFTEGNADMRELLGGKGANLAEMTNLGMPVPQGAASRPRVPRRTKTPSTMSTASCTTAWPTFPAPCLIPRRLRSPTLRFPTSSSSPTRAGAVPARKTANWNWGSTSCRAKWSTGPLPKPGGFPASRWRCNAVAGFPARSGFSCGDADLAFTPNKKRVVCIPPAFFVYLM